MTIKCKKCGEVVLEKPSGWDKNYCLNCRLEKLEDVLSEADVA